MKPRQESYRGVQPVKFLVWLIIIASIMLFGAVTSAIVVRSADGAWGKICCTESILYFNRYCTPEQFDDSTGLCKC